MFAGNGDTGVAVHYEIDFHAKPAQESRQPIGTIIGPREQDKHTPLASAAASGARESLVEKQD